MELYNIKNISIRDYLSRRGIQPVRENDRCGFYLSPLRTEHMPSFKVDAVVLNSVVNVGKVIPFLQQHRAVHTFFDNDEAGRMATTQVQQLAPAVEVVDQSSFYRGHNDLNDYLKSRQPVKEKKQTHGLEM